MITAEEAVALYEANKFHLLDAKIRDAAQRGYRSVTLSYADYGHKAESITEELTNRGYRTCLETDFMGDETLEIYW